MISVQGTQARIKPIVIETQITEKKYADKFIEKLNAKPASDAYAKNKHALELFQKVTDDWR